MFSHSVVSHSLRPNGLQHAGPSSPVPFPEVCPNSCPLSQWCYPIISSSAALFSFCLQSFPASGSFQMSQFFTSGDQSNGASASASVLPMNIQVSFPLGLIGWISLQSKGLSRVFSRITVPKHQFSAQLSLWSKSHIRIWLMERPSIQFSCSVVSNSLRPHESQHARPPCPSPTPRAYSNSCPLSWWCHTTISSSAIPFSSHLQCFPASGSFKLVIYMHQMANVLEFQLQHQSFQ